MLGAAAILTALAGCARRSEPPVAGVPPPAPPDPAIAEMAPHLGGWLALVQRAQPGIGVDSLRRAHRGPFTLHDIRPYNVDGREERARLRMFGVYAPDSTRVVDPDSYLEVSREATRISVGGEPDSKPVLIDLKTRSVTVLEFCGTDCSFDGAFWLDALRFALTGTVVLDTTGARCGRVRLYDLNDGTVTEYQLPALVDRSAWMRFEMALDSARVARFGAQL